MDDRRIEIARGKVIGGSSSINAMAYVRGNAPTTNAGRHTGCRTGPTRRYCPISENKRVGKAAPTHIAAVTAQLATRKARYEDPLVDAYLAGAQEMGYALNDDYNGAQQDGFARMQMTIRGGRRESAATGLSPSGAVARKPDRAGRQPCHPHRHRGRACGRCRIPLQRRAPFYAAEREVILSRRRDKFTADVDAIRHWRSRRIVPVRHSSESGSAGSWQKPAGSCCGASHLWSPRRKSAAADHAC